MPVIVDPNTVVPEPMYVVQTRAVFKTGFILTHAYGPYTQSGAAKVRKQFLAENNPLPSNVASFECNANKVQLIEGGILYSVTITPEA